MSKEASIKAEIKRLKAELKKYKNRKSTLESVKRNAPGKFNNAGANVGIKISGCAQDAYNALEGNKNTSVLMSDIRSYLQLSAYADPRLGPALDKVGQEITRCENKIKEIESKIKKLEAELKNLANSSE